MCVSLRISPFLHVCVLLCLFNSQVLHAPTLPRSDYLAAINGGVVGLCRLQTEQAPEAFGQFWTDDRARIVDGRALHGSRRHDDETPSSAPPATATKAATASFLHPGPGANAAAAAAAPGALAQPVFRCVGLGLVRAVDPDTGRLYVVTPVAETALQGVDLLVKGDLVLPTMLASCGEAGGLPEPYLVRQSLRSSDAGARAIRSRNNMVRPGGRHRHHNQQRPQHGHQHP